LRSLAAGVVYALLWFLYGYLLTQFYTYEDVTNGVDWYYPAICLVIVLAAGALTAHVSLDLDPATGAIHCGFFFVVTVLLRVVIGLQVLPGLVIGS